MTDNAPQMIMWDRENGVFRPVKILFDENHLGFDITKHLKPENDVPGIEPSTLVNIGSVYLGAIQAVNELALSNIVPDNYVEKLLKWQRAICGHIFQRSFDVATENNASYFSLFNAVDSSREEKTRPFRFSSKNFVEDDYKISFSKENLDFINSKNTVHWHIHPTVNLYVPRK